MLERNAGDTIFWSRFHRTRKYTLLPQENKTLVKGDRAGMTIAAGLTVGPRVHSSLAIWTARRDAFVPSADNILYGEPSPLAWDIDGRPFALVGRSTYGTN